MREKINGSHLHLPRPHCYALWKALDAQGKGANARQLRPMPEQ